MPESGICIAFNWGLASCPSRVSGARLRAEYVIHHMQIHALARPLHRLHEKEASKSSADINVRYSCSGLPYITFKLETRALLEGCQDILCTPALSHASAHVSSTVSQ
ncbi:hypothetical protein N656DRAFT_504752 [Canariomyces notabilis]|uniref:Uncharacterized protein n=1 Tax=Canariomyces notabilis TaxID=2074819 RepID=A0AAN6QF50_9PEZI|nr:hypothetical protein N656DRAFT_504752 [Canariomyces arenarius]